MMVPSGMINEKLRASDIKRWGMVRMVKQQSLAEHSFNVAVISIELANMLGEDPIEVCYYAIHHDMDEVFTGDIASHTKKEMKTIGFDPKELETEFGAKTTASVKNIIKAADFLEAMWFVLEYGHGRHAKEVSQWITNEYNKFVDDKPELSRAADKLYSKMASGNFMIIPNGWNTCQSRS